MSASKMLENVKRIDQESKDLIFGYIRNVQELFPADNVYYTIPNLVIHWILLYFYFEDKFDDKLCTQSYDLSDDKSIVTLNSEHGNRGKGPAFLSRIVKSKQRHCWRFRINHLNSSTLWMTIGVWKCNHDFDLKYRLDSGYVKGKFYGWIVNYQVAIDGGRHKYGKRRCKTGDIVDMILDLEKLELRYMVNDEDFGIAFENIEDTEYKAAISMNKSPDEIELIKYKILR